MFVTNLAGLIAVRFFLGFAEAGFFGGVVYYLTTFYKSNELVDEPAFSSFCELIASKLTTK